MKEIRAERPIARKEHRCMFCNGTIQKGEKYERQTNIFDGRIYDWICHIVCSDLAGKLNMMEWTDEGIDEDLFFHCVHDYVDENHYNRDTGEYDDGWDPADLSTYDLVLKIARELEKNKLNI